MTVVGYLLWLLYAHPPIPSLLLLNEIEAENKMEKAHR